MRLAPDDDEILKIFAFTIKAILIIFFAISLMLNAGIIIYSLITI